MNTTNKPKIGYVVEQYPCIAETFIVNEIISHEEAGEDIEIFSLRPPTETHFQGILSRVRAPVNYLPISIKAADFWEALRATQRALPKGSQFPAMSGAHYKDVYQALLLSQMIMGKNIQRLHAHFASTAATVTQLAASITGIPFTFTAHTRDIFHEGVDHLDLKRKLQDAQAVVTVSDTNVQYLRKKFKVSADKVKRVYNGLNLSRLPFQAPKPNQVKIVAVGRFEPKKGFSSLIEACAILADRGIEVKCEIIGSGPMEGELRQKIDFFDLHNFVKLSGQRTQKEIISAVQNAGIFVAPCIQVTNKDVDDIPTELLQAMALGTACLATNATGMPEVIREGETGCLVPQKNPEALADAMQTLINDHQLRFRLARGARDLIEAEFDSSRTTHQLRELFRIETAYVPQVIREAC